MDARARPSLKIKKEFVLLKKCWIWTVQGCVAHMKHLPNAMENLVYRSPLLSVEDLCIGFHCTLRNINHILEPKFQSTGEYLGSFY